MSNRRMLSIVVFASAVLMTACGVRAEPRAGEDESGSAAAVPSPSLTRRPECARGVTDSAPASSPSRAGATTSGSSASPENPHYDENHAYRMSGELAAENRAAGEASVRLIRPALETMRKNKRFAENDVRAVMAKWGCGDDNGLAISSGWPQYERVWFSFHTGKACVSAEITPEGVATEVYGAFAEPDPSGPCVENRGGH
ncbi:hypothetical protein [Streptomyces sp. 142MFCol3.1]|uniref:hypothetical protein n=1 Tax=Streptomyces sp. 142MFCol3.1 TaxID=1172179 RepID=UPI001F3F296E|nr:hypothetical protein [Streptomyces sp. 142MFCol3.1]